jgi:DNA primase
MPPDTHLRAVDGSGRVDTEALRREHPTADLVASYGIELRRIGAALVGRCPFHEDGGRPNLHVYRSGRWVCYRCGEYGDVIAFVQRIDNLSFRDAAARLKQLAISGAETRRRRRSRGAVRLMHRPDLEFGEDDVQVLSAAADFYASTLLNDERALRYLAGRGFPRGIVERYRLGYASGDELAPYLRWRRLPVGAAIRVGLLRNDGRESMAGRITMPEFRGQRPVWFIGRLLEPGTGERDGGPRYLGLPGRKPLLGWDDAVRDTRAVYLVEGPLDLLTLRMWGFPGLALAGSVPSHDNLSLLHCFDRVYLTLDQDVAGRKATERMENQLGSRAVHIELPPGVKDVAELAIAPNGEEQFRLAILRAVGASSPMSGAA